MKRFLRFHVEMTQNEQASLLIVLVNPAHYRGQGM